MQQIKIIFLAYLIITLSIFSASYYSFYEFAKKIANNNSTTIINLLKLFKNLFLPFEYDEQAKEFNEYLSGVKSRLDFSTLYNSKYLIQGRGGERVVVYYGEYTPSSYKIFLNKQDYESIQLLKFGDFRSQIILVKNTTPSLVSSTYSSSVSYSAFHKGSIHLEKTSHLTFLSFFEEILKVVDAENIQKMEIFPSQIYSELKREEERKVLGVLQKDFPKFSKYLNIYTKAASALYFYELDKKKITKIQIYGALNLRSIQRDAPFLADYLMDIQDLGWIHLELYNQNKFKLFEFHLDSEKLELQLVLFTEKGKLIPFTGFRGNEKLDFQNAIEFSKLKQIQFKGKISFYGNIYGLIFENNGFNFEGDFTNQKEQGKFFIRLKHVESTKVSGGFSYVIPSWLIDFFIPGDMEELVNHFFQNIVQSNHKKGAFLKLTLNKQKENWFINSIAEGEFIENFFLRLGLRVWNYKVVPSDDAYHNLAQLIARGVDILIDEYPK